MSEQVLSRRLLEITTVKTCSVDCHPFCPQRKFRAAYGSETNLLSFGDFQTALSHVPKEVPINFAGFSEPFLNRKGLDMLEYAYNQGHTVLLFSTLVGLRPDDIDRLKAVKFDWFSLHLPDPNGIAQIARTPNYEKTLSRVMFEVQIDDYSRMDDKFVSNERAGNCDNAPRRHVKGPFYCSKLVKPQFVMLPNCDVVLCCMDWGLKHRLGNLKTQTFDEIANSDEFTRIARNRWRMDGDTLCRSCKWALPMGRHAVRKVRAAIGPILHRFS